MTRAGGVRGQRGAGRVARQHRAGCACHRYPTRSHVHGRQDAATSSRLARHPRQQLAPGLQHSGFRALRSETPLASLSRTAALPNSRSQLCWNAFALAESGCVHTWLAVACMCQELPVCRPLLSGTAGLGGPSGPCPEPAMPTAGRRALSRALGDETGAWRGARECCGGRARRCQSESWLPADAAASLLFICLFVSKTL